MGFAHCKRQAVTLWVITGSATHLSSNAVTERGGKGADTDVSGPTKRAKPTVITGDVIDKRQGAKIQSSGLPVLFKRQLAPSRFPV